MKTYVDSDVIISSLLSGKGAAYFLLNNLKDKKVDFFMSNYSVDELEIVASRMGISKGDLGKTLKGVNKTRIDKSYQKVVEEFEKYSKDKNDAHIVAGAVKSNSEFLITYNLKDFKIEKIKRDFGIKILTPGRYLQYLRSIN